MNIEFGQSYPEAPRFIRVALWDIDPHLELNWEPKLKIWQLWRKNPVTRQRDHIFNYMNPDGSFKPLDYGICKQAMSARYYADHPELLEKMFVDDFLDSLKKDEDRERQDILHMAKDKPLLKKFNDVCEKIKSIPWSEWRKVRPLKNRDGSTVLNAENKPVMWQPHHSLLK